MAPRSRSSSWSQVVQNITTPLGFFVLALLIIEGTLSLVLTFAKLENERRWDGFLWMIGIFGALVLIVSIMAIFSPKNLLYGKEEHSAPQIDPSALHDQIEDIVTELVKDDCLKK